MRMFVSHHVSAVVVVAYGSGSYIFSADETFRKRIMSMYREGFRYLLSHRIVYKEKKRKKSV